MSFSYSYNLLKKYIQFADGIEVHQIVDTLNKIGLESEFEGNSTCVNDLFLVGEILATTKHPQASGLQICQVQTKNGQQEIVCGAPNARQGLKVIVALMGAQCSIGGEMLTIQEREIRGVKSYGMLCALSELGINTSSDGILELPSYFTLETNLTELFLDYTIITDITPNKGECYSIIGIARELAAAGVGRLLLPDMSPLVLRQDASIVINQLSLDPELAQAIYFQRCQISAKKISTPLEMVLHLHYSKIKSHNLLIDLTNLVFLITGQPLHSFDYAKLDPETTIELRMAREGEKILTLDQNQVHLGPKNIIIAQKDRVLSLAGVMGGMESGVDDDTCDILLEAASFKNQHFTEMARQYPGSRAAYRFARYVSPHYMEYALNMYFFFLDQVIQDYNKDQDTPIEFKISTISKGYGHNINSDIAVDVNIEKIIQQLGNDKNSIKSILLGLGYEIIAENEVSLRVIWPKWRFSNGCIYEEEIIADILRIFGFDDIADAPHSTNPMTAYKINPRATDPALDVRLTDSIIDQMIGKGYQQVLNMKFLSQNALEHCGWLYANDVQPGHIIELSNPINLNWKYMRHSIMPSLVTSIANNLHLMEQGISIFEIGTCFKSDHLRATEQNPIQEDWHLALASTGPSLDGYRNIEETLTNSPQNSHIANLLQDLLSICPVELDIIDLRDNQSIDPGFFHPYLSASLWSNDQLVGYIGQLHPDFLEQYQIKKPVYMAELTSAVFKHKGALLPRSTLAQKDCLVWDFTFTVFDLHKEIKQIAHHIRQLMGPLYLQHYLVDIYKEGDAYKVTLKFYLENNTVTTINLHEHIVQHYGLTC